MNILIVEDEREIADSVEYALTAAGMQVCRCETAGQAQHTLSETGFDLCILDIGLPDANGIEVLKQWRQQPSSYQEMPVIVLTARNEEIERIVGLEVGADDYVCKPFSPRELVARVKVILKRASASGASSISKQNTAPEDILSPFQEDQNRFEISYRGNDLKLTRSEYLLLAHLLQQPGRVFSRRQLIEATFSSSHPSDDRAIDTHIKGLRAKIKLQNPHKDHIKTHRGFGYSIEL